MLYTLSKLGGKLELFSMINVDYRIAALLDLPRALPPFLLSLFSGVVVVDSPISPPRDDDDENDEDEKA